MPDTGDFDALCRDIYAYYSNQLVPVPGDRLAMMLRATGEVWTKEELAQHTSAQGRYFSFNDFHRIAKRKRDAVLSATGVEGVPHVLVDDYGYVINLTVQECQEIVDAFKALLELRCAAGDELRGPVMSVDYFRHVLTSVGDAIPQRLMQQLLSESFTFRSEMSLRTLIKLLNRKR
ncbi:ATPase AAA, putative [Babesia ovata]|uniref:ATPase AAA, putative n=1 Tax=Babesia ovata TaxID=189622 RepID=A0A2H6KB90_9APIC|nr:ATPase AAA, putative [Babesia ovata]GBE60262.1 ATPase AAA, putative [Babesia ovata]